MNAIVCEQCGHEFAKVEEKVGERSLVVPPGMELLCVSNDPKKFVAVCPQCHHHTEVDAELLGRF